MYFKITFLLFFTVCYGQIVGRVRDCSSNVAGGVQLCTISVEFDGKIPYDAYPDRLLDADGTEYQPAFSSYLNINVTGITGSQYTWSGTYTQSNSTIGGNCSCTNVVNCTSQLAPAQSAQLAVGNAVAWVWCGEVGVDSFNNNSYWVYSLYSPTGPTFDRYTWQGNRVSIAANVSYSLAGFAGNSFPDFSDCKGAPFDSCLTSVANVDVPQYKDLFVNRADNVVWVMNPSIYSDPDYANHFFQVDWATYFSANYYDSTYNMPTRVAQACETWRGKCYNGSFVNTYNPILDIKGNGTAMSTNFVFSGVGQRGYGTTFGLSTNDTSALRGATFIFKDHLIAKIPQVKFVGSAIDCNGNFSVFKGQNDGEKGQISVYIRKDGEVSSIESHWINEGLFEFTVMGTNLDSACVGGACEYPSTNCTDDAQSTNNGIFNVSSTTFWMWFAIALGGVALVITIAIVIMFRIRRNRNAKKNTGRGKRDDENIPLTKLNNRKNKNSNV